MCQQKRKTKKYEIGKRTQFLNNKRPLALGFNSHAYVWVALCMEIHFPIRKASDVELIKIK